MGRAGAGAAGESLQVARHREGPRECALLTVDAVLEANHGLA